MSTNDNIPPHPDYALHGPGLWKFRGYRKDDSFTDFTLVLASRTTRSEAIREAWYYLRDPFGHDPHPWAKVLIEAMP